MLAEFLKTLQEMKKYPKLKEKIQRRNKAKAKVITKEQKEELLKQVCKQGRKYFSKKLTEGSGMQGFNSVLYGNNLQLIISNEYKQLHDVRLQHAYCLS